MSYRLEQTVPIPSSSRVLVLSAWYISSFIRAIAEAMGRWMLELPGKVSVT